MRSSEMHTLDKSILYMLLSTLSLSVTGLISKYLVDIVPIEWFSFLRFALPAVLLLVLLRITKVKMPNKAEMKPLLGRALCIALCQLFFLWSLQHLSLVESVVLFATGPLFMPLLERLFFKTSVSKLTIAALVATFVGVILLAGKEGEFSLRLELLAGLAGGLFNSGSQLTLYRASKSALSPKEINFWTFSLAALLLLPVLAFVDIAAPEATSTLQTWLSAPVAIALLTISCLIINTQVNRAKAYRLASSGSQLAPLIFTNLLFTSAWQWLFFDESFSLWQITGLGLIIFATMLNVLWPMIMSRPPFLKQRQA
ncbi:DMT family transporter [Vibrio vulnificus]|nr:DMT family transporter [Vibrio vulnificus]EGR0799492.1 DMT family transporter [Vibrio vulnificus]EGR0816703.1 DMT family transporter [Vibrio vulnificus]EGR0827413.1 DMT family transporter [Vibrio vulnificus]EGR0849594.1 DMT family transporter [Vibrio vulnificus]